MKDEVLAALREESDRLSAVINELQDRNLEVPEGLWGASLVAANVAKMVESDGVVDTLMALVATYPAAVFEENFDVYEERKEH